MARKGFCIFKKGEAGERLVQRNEEGLPRTYPTRDMAEQEVARSVVERIFSYFNETHLQSEDSLSVCDHIEEVNVLEGGEVIDRRGTRYGKTTS